MPEAESYGSGFLIGPNTLMTAYHVLEARTLETRIGHQLVWNGSKELTDVDLHVEGTVTFAIDGVQDKFMERALRRRLAQLGLHREVQEVNLDHLRVVEDSVVLDQFVHNQQGQACKIPSHDVALLKLSAFPLHVDTILERKPSYLPPGVLYDWFPVPLDDKGTLDPARMPSLRPTYKDEERLAAAHVNHLSTDLKDLGAFADLKTLISLPAPRELPALGNVCNIQKRCVEGVDPFAAYQGCHGADMDLIGGSSGGAVVFFQNNGEMSTVGVVHAGNSPADHWLVDGTQPGVNDTDGVTSRFTHLQDFMFANTNTGQRSLELEPIPKVTDDPQKCQGDCSDILGLKHLRCRAAFEDGIDRPMLGLLGSPDDAQERLGSVAAVCGLNSKAAYTNTWGGLRTLGISRRKSLSYRFPQDTGTSLMGALRRAHLRYPMSNGKTEAKPLPMQLCRPGQLLVGVRLGLESGEINHIEALLCRTRDNIRKGSPGDPDLVLPEVQTQVQGRAHTITQHLGDMADTSGIASVRSQCPPGEAMMGIAANDVGGRGDTTTTSLALLCGELQ